jgi:hypothetical protein
MLEADTEAGRYWEECGRQALKHNVKGIIIMVSSVLHPNLTLLIYSRVRIGSAWETKSKSQRIHLQAKALAPSCSLSYI